MRNSRTREVTLRDVARAAGVHYSTASRSLDPINVRLINPATVVRVQQAAQELGYRPDLVARGLRRGRTGTIGIVVADLANPYIAPVLRGIAESLESRGVMPLIVETLDDQARLKRLLATLLSRRIDAIITSAARRGYADILTEVANAGTPVVLAVRDLANSGLPVVTHDDLRGGELAARHLIELGHRRLTQLRGPSDIQSFSDRGEGFEPVRPRVAEGQLHLVMQCRVVLFERQRVVPALLDDLGRNRGLAAQRVDGHQAPGRVEQAQQQGDGGDLVRLVIHRHLPEHQPARPRPGAHQVQRRLPVGPIVRAPQRLREPW